jgi:hypothetical protein
MRVPRRRKNTAGFRRQVFDSGVKRAILQGEIKSPRLLASMRVYARRAQKSVAAPLYCAAK